MVLQEASIGHKGADSNEAPREHERKIEQGTQASEPFDPAAPPIRMD